MTVVVRVGDSRELLREIPDGSVHCVVMSPPYFGLRDYGTATWEGGDPSCSHVVGEMRRGIGLRDSAANTRGGAIKIAETPHITAKAVCPHCGAIRVDRQIGIELTPAAYIEAMLELGAELWRVLRDDGTLWINIGDSYANDGKWGGATGGKQAYLDDASRTRNGREKRRTGLKPKDLIGIPWRLAFAFQDAGWWLRQDVIWHKPNPMPESVKDRFTKAHEYLFLFAKGERYYFDADAVAEEPLYTGLKGQDDSGFKRATDFNGKHASHPHIRGEGRSRRRRGVPPLHAQYESSDQSGLDTVPRGAQRNKRDVWTISSDTFDGEFCTACKTYHSAASKSRLRTRRETVGDRETVTRWCSCGRPDAWLGHFAVMPQELARNAILAGCPVGGTVLDPFGGAGTTALVAEQLQRDAILLELNPDYAEMSRQRVREDAGLLGSVS